MPDSYKVGSFERQEGLHLLELCIDPENPVNTSDRWAYGEFGLKVGVPLVSPPAKAGLHCGFPVA
jgi:hypothetical protein